MIDRKMADVELAKKIELERVERKKSINILGGLIGFGIFVLGAAATSFIDYLVNAFK